MCKKIKNFRDKALVYKKYVEKDDIDSLFNDMKKDSIKELTRIKANQEADATGTNAHHSQRLISFVEAELSDRNIKHLRWHRWTISAATFVIAITSIINLSILLTR